MAEASLSLRERIEALPEELRDALERTAKYRRLVAEIEQDIESERRLSTDDVELDEDPLADLEAQHEQAVATQHLAEAVERIKLQVLEAESKAEVAFRATAVKPTDTYVRAAVGADPDVVTSRAALAEAKAHLQREELTLRFKEDQRREKARQARELDRTAHRRRGPDSGKVFALRMKLVQAQEQLDKAEAAAEVAHVMVDTYRMLLTLDGWERSFSDSAGT